jgi:hypothetical protein
LPEEVVGPEHQGRCETLSFLDSSASFEEVMPKSIGEIGPKTMKDVFKNVQI